MNNRLHILFLSIKIVLGLVLVLLLLGRPAPVQAGTPPKFIFTTPCASSPPEQPIPDDGSWLQICLIDPTAPVDTTVTTVNVKYLVEHPDPTQLEVRLSREDGGVEIVLWEGGAASNFTEYGLARNLEAFQGTPSQGEWYLFIRDVVPGQGGVLTNVSLVVDYLPTHPLPKILSGSPGRPASRHLPEGIVPSQTPDRNPEKEEYLDDTPLSSNGWQVIKHETFEGIFPNDGWTRLDVYPDDNKEYLWDDDNYRPHNGSWAGWPARGGADGYDPSLNPCYQPHMDSWMIYGPFDLSDATFAEVDFWLWRQIEADFDRISFLYSDDWGENWYGIQWDGEEDWQEFRVDISHLAGEPNILVAWVFESDFAVQYEGPWVDDIWILKAQAGSVNVQGTLSYSDRNGNTAYGRNYKVSLFEDDADGQDDLLWVTYTDRDGFFSISYLTNWDWDENDYPVDPRLDLYVVWETDNPELNQQVTYFDGTPYHWESDTRGNISDGITEIFDNLIVDSTLPAMWIYEDMLRAYEYMLLNTGVDPGGVMALWEDGIDSYGNCTGSCFIPGEEPRIFISDQSRLSRDTVVHEVGHHYMWNKTNWVHGCGDHSMFIPSEANCAWSEGWADFLPLPVNGDTCYDFGIGPCSGSYYDLEAHSLTDPPPPPYYRGDMVEGRVAGALYDLFDTTNEDFDSDDFGMVPLTEVVFQEPLEQSFPDFWESWKVTRHSQHNAVRTFYQNTIDYDTPPYFEPLLPDRTVLQGVGWDHAIGLWSYSRDEESEFWELDWQIVYTSDLRCGVTIDENDYVNIHPQDGWLGSCYVTIRVSDSLKMDEDTFRVDVVEIQSWVYLPVVIKNSP
ncbi:MAG: hypothetical protein WA110_04745 [Anaerolineaceae bacterium]